MSLFSALSQPALTLKETAQNATSPTQASIPTGTPEQLADYLTDGYWNDDGGSRRHFDTSISNIITVNISDLTSAERKLAIAAMEGWEMVADINFQITTSNNADIVFLNDDAGNSWDLSAYSYSGTSGSNITYSVIVVSSGWIDAYGNEVGSYGFQTYMHELGHAIGLGHQSYYNGVASYPSSADFANDSWQMSIMSYFDQDMNTSVDASYALVVSPMMADIVAVQDLYGTPNSNSPTAGDTIWGKGTNLTNYLGDVIDDVSYGTTTSYSGDPITFTIYDVSGTDLIDLSFTTTGDRVDMRAGTFSDVAGLTGNVGIALGTVIENLNAGSGNDTITGNSAANEIHAGAGNDTVNAADGTDRIFGGTGADHLKGQGGNDIVSGDDGADTISGGGGNDYGYGGTGNDTLSGDDGNDRLYGQNGNDVLRGGNGSDKIYGGNGNDSATGDAGNDTLSGNDGSDRLYGGSGSDTINGDDGWDRLYGQDGDDIMSGGQGNDRLYGGNNNDKLYGGIDDDSMTGNAGNDRVYGGSGNDRVYGGDGYDRVYGGDGSDRIYGQNDNDIIHDGKGSDFIYGGGGNDQIYIEGGNDIVFGNSGADNFIFNGNSGGTDTIRDFELGVDTMTFDSSADGYVGPNMNGQDIIDTYGSTSGGNTILAFGGGPVIVIQGIADPDTLADSILVNV